MKRLTLLLLLVLSLPIILSRQFAFPTRAQQSSITMIIASPTHNGLSDTTLSVAVLVTSTFQVSTVKAKVEDRESTLSFSACAHRTRGGDCQPGWAGTISLAGLARGSRQVIVTTTDIFNNAATAQATFIYDQPARLTVSGLVNNSVARPTLRVKASCTDDDPAGCKELDVIFNDTSYVTGLPKSFDGEISLLKFNGQRGNLCIRATDSANQRTLSCQNIYVETSPMLIETLSLNGLILDVQENLILFNEPRNGRDVLKVHNRLTGAETELAALLDGKLQPDYLNQTAFLTPTGAIFSMQLDGLNGLPGNSVLRESRDGQLMDLGPLNSSNSLQVAGRYAIWNSPALFLRDLTSGTTKPISSTGRIGNWMNSLTPSGEIIFWAGNDIAYHIYRYRNDQVTQLTSKEGVRDVYPLTDGRNIVFIRYSGPVSQPAYEIVLLTDSGETILASGTGNLGRRNFLLNNGWVAYSKPNSSGAEPLWLRSPSGQETQKSFLQAPTEADSLSPTGEVTFTNNSLNRRYLPLPGQPPIEIGTLLGRPFWQNGKLFLTIGRSLFQYAPLASVSAASFSGATLATEGITAVFGSRLATATQVAATQPLPTSLAGTSVMVRDSLGMQRVAPLFFVSPGQINYQIPPGTAAGQALITITGGDGTVSSGTAQIAAVAPSLFTANASGQGVPAATLLRVKANGEQVYEPVAVFDSNLNQFVARTIQLGPESEQDFLILFGTGLRYRSALSNVTATIRGESVPVLYAGPQPDFVGLDQVNIALPRNLANRGSVDVVLMADQQITNAVRISIN